MIVRAKSASSSTIEHDAVAGSHLVAVIAELVRKLADVELGRCGFPQ